MFSRLVSSDHHKIIKFEVLKLLFRKHDELNAIGMYFLNEQNFHFWSEIVDGCTQLLE